MTVCRLPRDDERVARALDGEEPALDAGTAGLEAVAEQVRDLGRKTLLDPDPRFRAALRDRLLAQADGRLPRPRTPDGSDRPYDVPARAHRRGAARRPAGPPTTRPGSPQATRPDSPQTARPGSPQTARPGSPVPASRLTGAIRPSRPRRSYPPGRRARQRALVAGALIAFALSGGTLAASGDSLPGQPLYRIRLAVENVEATFARDDAGRGRKHLAQARSRAERIGGLAARAGHTQDLIATLADMDDLTRTGFREVATAAVERADGTALTELATWVFDQQTLVSDPWPQLSDPARQRATASLYLLRQAFVRVNALSGLPPPCACAAPSADELGPLPERCPPCPEPAKGLAAATRSRTGRTPAAPSSRAPSATRGPTPAAPSPDPPHAPPRAGTGSPTVGPASPTKPRPPQLPGGSSPRPSMAPAPQVPTPTST